MSHSELFDNILEILATAPHHAIGDFLMDLFRLTKRTECHRKILDVFLRGSAFRRQSNGLSHETPRSFTSAAALCENRQCVLEA